MASLADEVYQHSPIWLQQMMVTTYGWWWYRRRFNQHFHKIVREYKARERWSEEQFHKYQNRQLEMLLRAAQQAPYYQKLFHEIGLDNAMLPFDALARLPLLSKEILRTHARELLTQSPPSRGTIVQKSSGTTGTPSEIYYNPVFHAHELAVPEARNLNWAGVTYQDRRVMFGVRKVCRFDQDRPPFWRFSLVEDMAYASVYHLAPKYLPSYMSFLRHYRPTVIMGYPSALNVLAQYALETGDMPAPAKAVFTTSETVTTVIRDAIEATWQCRIYDRYGAVESCMFASQCEAGRYHVSPEVGIIEILDRHGQPCPPGEIGEVICTGLQNTLQPLIRYRIGDAGRWSTVQRCDCGRDMPILEAIEGRFEDICFTPDGRQMLRFDTVFKGVSTIKEAQVEQTQLAQFIIRIVPANNFSEEDISRIKHNMRLHAGDVDTRVEFVTNIPRSSSGKFRAVICGLPAETIKDLRNKVPAQADL